MGEYLRGIHVRIEIDTTKRTIVVDRDAKDLDDARAVIEEAADEADL